MKKKAIVICNGEMPPKKIIKGAFDQASPRPLVICADGGANKARRFRIRPDVIIGDLDSITRRTRRHFARVKTILIRDQNSTDLEKALDYLIEKKIYTVIVIGATGRRTDHTAANFSIIKKYSRAMNVVFLDEYCETSVIRQKISWNAPLGQTISLSPLGRCDGITTHGLKYPLRNETLELGVREGASNEVVSNPVSIEVKKGSLLMFIVRKR
jgi:thiamine pyrophosphokinase